MFEDEENDNAFYRMYDSDEEEYDGGEEPQPNKSKRNPIIKKVNKVIITLSRWFITVILFLYPKEESIPYYVQGEVMKKTLFRAFLAHFLFFITSLNFVGFQSTIFNFTLACWSYSLYLTLNQWQVWLYLIFLGGVIAIGIMFGYKTLIFTSQKVFLIINLIFYSVAIVFVIKAYIPFALKGGIYGRSGKQRQGTHGTSAKKIFAEACKDLKGTEMWTDNDFPATMESIKGNSKDLDNTFGNVQQVCDGWIRATNFPNAGVETPQIFTDGISPNDVAQGQLGDCYLLAALATLAEWPHRIQKIYLSTTSDHRQIFGIWLFKNGMKTHVLIDNYFPVLKKGYTESGKPIFAKSHGNELWPAIAEKCYAKYHKGYCIIEGGNTGPTMRELTGAPTYMHNFKRGEQIDGLWEKLLEGEKLNYGMSAGTDGKDQGVLDDNGIVPGHAYTLIAAKEVKNKNGNKERLVKLRNPWKKGEWNGRYNDKSADWTDALKKQLKWTDEDDGIFWMPYDDMCFAYSVIDICKIDDDNIFSYMPVNESKKGFAFIKFKYVKNSTKKHLTTFAVSQKDCRAEEADGNSTFDLNSYTRRIKVEIMKVVDPTKSILEPGNCIKLEDGVKEQSPYALREKFIEFKTFKAGTYYMYIKIQWNGKAATTNYSVNCYAPSLVNFLPDESLKFTQEQIESLKTQQVEVPSQKE